MVNFVKNLRIFKNIVTISPLKGNDAADTAEPREEILTKENRILRDKPVTASSYRRVAIRLS